MMEEDNAKESFVIDANFLLTQPERYLKPASRRICILHPSLSEIEVSEIFIYFFSYAAA